MSPWDLYGQVRYHLHGGRLTMEQVDDSIRFEWWPRPTATLTLTLSLREFQACEWGCGRSIAEQLWLEWRA